MCQEKKSGLHRPAMPWRKTVRALRPRGRTAAEWAMPGPPTLSIGNAVLMARTVSTKSGTNASGVLSQNVG